MKTTRSLAPLALLALLNACGSGAIGPAPCEESSCEEGALNNAAPTNNASSNNTDLPGLDVPSFPGPDADPDPGGADATPDLPPGPNDRDGDGASPPDDCDDDDPDTSPSARERCGDGRDNDCDGQIDEGCEDNNASAPQPVGAACAAGPECSGGGCIGDWPGGYCTAQCGQNTPCPNGSDCYALNTSQGSLPLCLQACASRAQCRPGYACFPTDVGGACAPACTRDADCNGGTCDAASGTCQQADPGNNNPDPNNNTQNPPATGQLSTQTITSAGNNRQYLVYIPNSYTGDQPVPLVLAFHGRGDTAANFYPYSQLGNLAEGRGFILAVMQGLNNDWAVHTLPASANPDVAFANDVIDRLEAQLNIDASRIYAIGYSNGGFFTYLLGMTQANRFAAINVQASGSPIPGQLTPNAPRDIPVYIIIGTNDSLLTVARNTRDELQQHGHPVMYEELPGVGHCCYQYTKNNTIWSFLSTYSLP